jgi:ATP-dependent Clp protease protease subunit
LNSINLAAKKSKKKKEPDEEVVENEVEQKEEAEKFLSSIISMQESGEAPPKLSKLIHLFGEIEEEKCGDIVCALRILGDIAVKDEGAEEDPVELVISTAGGAAADMFAVYDTMRLVRDKGCVIATTGVGKVMSAGVLLLAAGTKGKRRVGVNCRIMLHGVASGHAGQINSLENELEEVRWTQEQYIKALAEETDMTPKYIKKLIEKGINVYLNAKEAVELGIADETF